LYQAVRADFGARHPRTLTFGRPSTPGETLLRLLLLKHLHGWSFQETEDQVDQNLILRWFCRRYWRETPDDTTLIRWSHTLQPETLHRLVERTAELAQQARITKGRKLRLDATCVQTNIHHPTDSGLLVDRVRVLSRLVKRAKGLVQDQVHHVEQRCRSRLLTARRVAQTLHRQLRRKGEEKEAKQQRLDQKLVETTEQMVHQATQVVQALAQRTEGLATRLVQLAQEVLPLVERVLQQMRQRVLSGKKVAAVDTVLSLFEPHTKAISRHKGGATVEFGRQVMLDEVDGGIITRFEIREHPTEHGQAIPAVEHQVALFEHPPGLVTDDRGVHSADTEERLHQLGVKRVALPASGKLSAQRQAEEHTRAFRRGYRFRAGTPGRIASLRRDSGWRECQ
jgi:IS5 family transposase